MKEGAIFPRSVLSDMGTVLGAVVAAGDVTTEDLVGATRLPLARVRAALALLSAAQAIAWRVEGRGSSRSWSFKGPATVQLWEPAAGPRLRRLYVTRSAALEASRRSLGPSAEANAITLEASAGGKLTRKRAPGEGRRAGLLPSR